MHLSRSGKITLASLLLVACAAGTAAGQAYVDGPVAAAPFDPTGLAGQFPVIATVTDSEVEMATLLQQPPALSVPGAPAARPSVAVPQRRNIRLASTPNMFGDSGEGGCGGLYVAGALAATIEHPLYACSRLNIAENNSPMVRDRIYYSYRHFENATDVDIFSYSPQGRRGELNIDRHIFGFEKTVGDAWSVEMRLPVNTQLSSDLRFVQTDSGITTDGSNNNLDEILQNRNTSIGNLDLIFKRRLYEGENFYLSGGFGFNLPTAQSVRIRADINDPNFQIYDPDAGGLQNGPLPTGDAIRLIANGTYFNQTVNLLPYMAFVWTPMDDWFTQGFMQIDVPLNESPGEVGILLGSNGNRITNTLANPDTDRLALQTLLRLNYGLGRWLYRNDNGYVNALGAVLEFHYATTLNDADVSTLEILDPLQVSDPVLNRGLTAGFGNLENRIDVVNCVVGMPIHMGMTSVYTGFTFPVGCGCAFDLEYMLSVNRRF